MSAFIIYFLLFHPVFVLSCLSSTPSFSSRRAAKARASLNLDDEDNALDVNNLRQRSSKCPSPLILPYSGIELRTIASLYPFNDEPEAPVQEGGRLTCSFDDDKEYCSWYNVQSGGVRFWKARYESIFDMERFDCTSERSFPFEDFILLAGGEMTILPQTVAVETMIPCQFGNATLTFDFWINSEEPVLRLCAITNDNSFNCKEMAEWDFNAPISTSIPASIDPFKLRIEISGLTSDTIVLIDNIRYVGQICELINDEVQITREEKSIETEKDEEKGQETGIKSFSIKKHGSSGSESTTNHHIDDFNQEAAVAAPPPPPPDEEGVLLLQSEKIDPVKDSESVDVCDALTCTFNEQHSCLYSLGGIGSTSSWSHAHEFIGNRLTGVHQNSPGDYKTTGFVYVGQNHKDVSDEVFVMESAKFTVRRSVQLIFDLFLRSYGPQLKVCIDSFDYCPYSSPTVDKTRFWYRNQSVYIPPGIRKIYFIAGKVRQNLFLAVDNIQIRSENGDSFCDTNNGRRLM